MALNGNSDITNGYNSVIKNGDVANANLVKAVIPPIGSVVSWLKSFTNTPTLPDGWVECNGQTLGDTDSPYNGQTIPDLNGSSGDQRFLLGDTTSGTTGGVPLANLNHTHSISWEQTSTNAGAGTFYSNTQVTGSTDVTPPHYTVVWIMRVK